MNDLTRIIRECERLGLKYERGRRHPKIRNPQTGRAITISSTPSCPHAHKHVIRDVRKYLGVAVS
jgi:hypothetical protein